MKCELCRNYIIFFFSITFVNHLQKHGQWVFADENILTHALYSLVPQYKTEREEILPFFENPPVVETISFWTERGGDLAETRNEEQCVSCTKNSANEILILSCCFWSSCDVRLEREDESKHFSNTERAAIHEHEAREIGSCITRASELTFCSHPILYLFTCRFHYPTHSTPPPPPSTPTDSCITGSTVISCKYHPCTKWDNLINAVNANESV